MNGDYTLLLLLVILIVLNIIFIYSRRGRGVRPLEKPVIKTIIECENCSYKVERDFKKGDFILKIEGQCPKCKGRMLVTRIFTYRPQKPK